MYKTHCLYGRLSYAISKAEKTINPSNFPIFFVLCQRTNLMRSNNSIGVGISTLGAVHKK